MEKIKMKIPFDIKYRPQIESGEYKVVTRDGSPVRIICWDRKSAGDGQPIVALVEKGHYENSIWVEENGVYKGTMGHEYDLLILTPEPELTEFEEMLYSIFDAYNGLKIDVRAAVDVNAKTLLELAKKEICKGCTVSIDSYIKGRDDERIIDTIVSVLGQYIDYKTVSGTGSGYATPRYAKEIDWLNSLRTTNQEWSKEDEEMRKLLIAILEVNHPDGFFKANELGTTDMHGVHTEEIISWLKSLRPSLKPDNKKHDYITPHKKFFQWIYDRLVHVHKENPDVDYMRSFKERINNLSFEDKHYWKPSEQEKCALRTAIYILTDERSFPKTAAQLQNILDAFKGEESRKDWKPSEEQMRALSEAVSTFDGYEESDAIKSLYKDLKKLM